MLLLAAAGVGVDFGWQPIAGGGVEYIIQIEPELLESLASGRADIVSEIPPFLRGVRSYRITVGTGPLPHHGEPPPVEDAADDEGGGMPSPGGDPFAGTLGGLSARPLRRMAIDGGSDVNPAAYEEDDATASDESSEGAAGRKSRQGSGGSGEQVADDLAQVERTRNAADEADDGTPHDTSPSDNKTPPPADASSKPWLPLGLALVALCASLAGNAYQGWVAFGLRQRYLLLLARGPQA
jgi:hypothetical protein